VAYSVKLASLRAAVKAKAGKKWRQVLPCHIALTLEGDT
jgi:hypothetical protein